MSDILIYTIAIVGGFVAGVINTLAGNGSAITLGIFTELLGLPANVANGTNRIGVLLQSASSYAGLKRNTTISVADNKYKLGIIFVGAVLGGIVASVISNEHFKVVYQIMMVVMLLTILAKPSRWLKTSENLPLISKSFLYPILLLLGFYGGFIQMGMGLLFLAVMVLLDGKKIMESNTLKVFIVMIFSIVVLGIFVVQGLVNWQAGLIVAIGQASGGYVTGRYIARSPKAELFAYYTLLIVIIFVLIKMFFF